MEGPWRFGTHPQSTLQIVAFIETKPIFMVVLYGYQNTADRLQGYPTAFFGKIRMLPA
jgi:hypothetical protein